MNYLESLKAKQEKLKKDLIQVTRIGLKATALMELCIIKGEPYDEYEKISNDMITWQAIIVSEINILDLKIMRAEKCLHTKP